MHRRIGILALCAIIGLLPPASVIGTSMPAITAHAIETAKSGTWGEVSWDIDAEGTLTVSGTGRMGVASSSYSSDDSPWSYRYDIKRAVIEEGVTNIAPFAFYDCLCLTSVTIADSVTDIEDGAFSACGSLTSVTLPAGLTWIGPDAFRGCWELESLNIPASVTDIGSNTFDGCSSLSELTFPDNLELIGAHAFRDTAWLADHPLAVIGHILADGTLCKGNVVIPADVTSVANAAFEGCTDLTSVTISDQVTDIGAYAFRDCTGLTSVHLPASLTNVSCGLFKNCTGLTAVKIPESVTSIGDDAFSGCTSLASVTLPEGQVTVGKGAFSGTAWQYGNSLIIIQGVLSDGSAAVGDVDVPDGTRIIASDAFSWNKELTSIDLPASVTCIEEASFAGCTGVQSFTIRNPYCRLMDLEGSISESAVIYGYEHSTAHWYAEKNGMTFVALDGSPTPDYTYEIIPLLPPLNQYFYVKTDNPDPYSFRFYDKDTVYGEAGSIALWETLCADVKYEDPETFRVSGGYIFSGSHTDGGELML